MPRARDRRSEPEKRKPRVDKTMALQPAIRMYALAKSNRKSPAAPARLDFRTIFETYGPLVTRTLRRLDVPSADLNDLRQEIFVLVHRRLPELDDRTGLRTWIYGICVRVASTFRRSARF